MLLMINKNKLLIVCIPKNTHPDRQIVFNEFQSIKGHLVSLNIVAYEEKAASMCLL